MFFVYISLFLNMPEKHTGILNPGLIVWEVALLYNLLLRSIPFNILIRKQEEILHSWISHFWMDFPLYESFLKFHWKLKRNPSFLDFLMSGRIFLCMNSF